MSWIGLPPGNILQQLYLKERVNFYKNKYQYRKFLEIGSGNGHISYVLLNNGYKGVGIDLNNSACLNNQKLNQKHILLGNYQVINNDFLSYPFKEKFDIIIACMVIEHIPDNKLKEFLNKIKSLLSENGTAIFFVPSNMRYWNIEDEIAGHIKRYEFKDIKKICEEHKFSLVKIAALNYPISNVLFHLSNYLIEKHESNIKNLSQKEKTIYTGNRNVPFKTTFPKILNLILNPIVLYPFHILQKLFLNQLNHSLVLYFEIKNK